MKICLVTSADRKYTPLLRELLASIYAHPQAGRVFTGVGIIDAGLDPAVRQDLVAHGCLVADGLWPVPLSDRRIGGREYLKACVSRPFIPQLFPGFDLYVWLDADTWVQDWHAIDLLIAGAQKSQLAVVPQVDRAYGKTMRLGWLGPLPFRPRSFYYSNARKSFGGKIARRLFPFPTINAGVFAMAADAPHWQRWQDLIKETLAHPRANIFTAEQLTLGMLIYLEGYSAERLPATCNWLCETKPVFDKTQRRFIEPYLPHQPIGILHLSGYDSMRADPRVLTDIKCLDGSVQDMSLRFPAPESFAEAA